MTFSAVGHNPAISGFAPFSDVAPAAAPTAPAAGAAASAAAIEAYQPETQAIGQVRSKRGAETSTFVINRVGNSLDDVVGSDRVRGELDKVVAAIKGMNVSEVEIKTYYPMFKELGKPRGEAVKNYLVLKGVDRDVIDVKPRGPGYGNKDSGLAKERAVKIEISGTPKQGAETRESALPVKREAGFLPV